MQAQAMRRGRLLAPDDKPLANAKVFAIDLSDSLNPVVITTVTTDADGRFGIMGLPQRSQLLVQAAGYAWSSVAVSAPGAEAAETRLIPATALRLRFLGPDDRPAAGVRISVLMILSRTFPPRVVVLPDSLQQQLAQTTDAQGYCTLANLPRECVVRPTVLDDRYAQITVDHNITLAGTPESDGGVIKLADAATVSGRVVFGDSGEPVVGVRVGAQGADHNPGGANAVTDKDGKFLLRQMSGGLYNIALDLRGDLGKRYTAVAHELLEVRAGDRLEQKDFKLISGSLIRGRAYVAGTDKPVADLQIGVYRPAHPKSSAWVQGTQTAADGAYEFRVPPGEQFLYIMGPTPPGLHEPPDRERNLTVVDGQTISADFVFGEDLAPGVSGRVVDPEGRPVAGVMVTVEFNNSRRAMLGNVRAARTDAQGRFTLPAVPNGAVLRASGDQWISAERIVISDANRTLTLTVRKDAFATIRIRVLQADGSPAAKAPVHLTTWESTGGIALTSEHRAGDDGVLELKSLRPDTRYDVAAGGSGFTRDRSSNVKMTPGQTTEITLTVTAVNGFIAGSVVDSNGKPVPNLSLLVEGDGDNMTRTDAQGRFRVEGLPPGQTMILYPQSPKGFSEPAQIPVGTDNAQVLFDPKPFPSRP